MPIPVTIADDSLMSRKAVRRALPPEWDVDITEACNGKEALLAVESGKAEVLFLDLTMPELDGIGVLEAIKAEGIDCFVIVISADIQPEMKKRVMELGALAFIHKPVNEEKLHSILKQYGLI